MSNLSKLIESGSGTSSGFQQERIQNPWPHLSDNEGLLLGMGNPLLDISATVEDSFLKKYNMKPDDAIMAEELHKPLYKELQEVYKTEFIAGGSVQNSLRVAQWILQKPKVTTYFGSVGTDEYAKILQNRATADGVNVKYQYTDAEVTGTCAVLITGTHRSLCANLAAANLFTEEHLTKPDNKKLIEAAKYYYVSGFFLAVSPPSIMNLAKHSLANDHTFVMNLSAPFVSQFYKKELSAVLPYVDILFGNETEAHTFAKEFNIEEEDLKCIALKLCQHPKQNEKKGRVVVITQGCHPVLLARNGDVSEIPVTALSPEQIVDTNGAGDAFVGGFLAQLVLERPYDECVKCGIYAASNIIQQSGCTFTGKAEFAS